MIDPYEQRNARVVGPKDEVKPGKGKKKQQKSSHNVKKQTSEVINSGGMGGGTNNGKAKITNY